LELRPCPSRAIFSGNRTWMASTERLGIPPTRPTPPPLGEVGCSHAGGFCFRIRIGGHWERKWQVKVAFSRSFLSGWNSKCHSNHITTLPSIKLLIVTGTNSFPDI
jgi:hypothetical protein